MAVDPIAIASDHGGIDLKTVLVDELKAAGVPILDLGTMGRDSVDYPDYADALAHVLKDGKARRGVLVCGTGIGMSIGANSHKGIRARSAMTRPTRASRASTTMPTFSSSVAVRSAPKWRRTA